MNLTSKKHINNFQLYIKRRWSPIFTYFFFGLKHPQTLLAQTWRFIVDYKLSAPQNNAYGTYISFDIIDYELRGLQATNICLTQLEMTFQWSHFMYLESSFLITKTNPYAIDLCLCWWVDCLKLPTMPYPLHNVFHIFSNICLGEGCTNI